MRIQPISANQQTDFGAMKVRKLNIKPRKLKTQLTPEQEQSRNYTQAALFALAFCAATMTKYFIDICNGKHKAQQTVEVRAEQPAKQTDTNVYQLK